MRMVELIEKKRDGLALSKDEIRFIMQGYVQGEIPDYQISAWAMAVYFQGMTVQETAELTMVMAESGKQITLSLPGKTFVDKHSSGGVGDKTTLIVAPLVAACGVPVAKMSGRGLGHTGGTIDRLSAIPGFRVEMEEQEFLNQVKEIGIAVIAQTGDIVPADKKLYELRDVTATVDSIPLIASSIMSKKIAAGAQAIVLDVKYGRGAFMSSAHQAIGNSIEVLEAIDTLQGKGPDDLLEVCLELGSWMLVAGKKADKFLDARAMLEDVLQSGMAWKKFLEFVKAQGGDAEMVRKRELSLASFNMEYKAEQAGYIQKIDARKIGHAAMILGAGRETKESAIDFGAGIFLLKKIGDPVQTGDPLCTLYTSSAEKFQEAVKKVAEAFTIGEQKLLPKSIVSSVIE